MVLTDSGLFDFWLRFGSVTGFFKPAPSPELRQKPKILAADRYIFSVNALAKRRGHRRKVTVAAQFGFSPPLAMERTKVKRTLIFKYLPLTPALSMNLDLMGRSRCSCTSFIRS
jgi:hypothetical protein